MMSVGIKSDDAIKKATITTTRDNHVKTRKQDNKKKWVPTMEMCMKNNSKFGEGL